MARWNGMTVVLVAALALLAASCQKGEKTSATLGATDVPDQEFTDFTTTESDSGVARWTLAAPVARVYNSRKLLVTDNPRVEFFDAQGMLASILTSDKGEYNQVTHDLTALGNVVITSIEGYTLETQSLVWVEKLGDIHSEEFVRFTKGESIVTGYGFNTDPGLKNVVIKRDIRGFFKDDADLVGDEVRKETEEGKRE